LHRLQLHHRGGWLHLQSDWRTPDGYLSTPLRSRMAKSVTYPYTYDILPASDTGTYVASGKLIGTTLEW